MSPIAITNNYYTDLNAAIAAGAITVKGAKNPRKDDLYAAINAHNASIADEPTGDELLALDAAEDAAKAAQVQLKSVSTRKAKSSKMQQFEAAVLSGASDDELMQLTGWKLQGVKGWKGVVLSRAKQPA